ncbi:MAG: FtsX-like permease family protein [Candidatus Thorarchaeota archaeon]
MAAVPVGYEAFHSLRRRSVTLLCFVLASTLAMGITVFVDSYSVHEWDKNLDIGDVAIRVTGGSIQSYIDDIQGLPYITKAEGLRYGYGNLERDANETAGIEELYAGGYVLTPSQEFLDAYPNYISLVRGRMPQNATEIVAINSLATYYDVNIGDELRCSISGGYTTVEVVGFFTQQGEGDSPYYWSYDSIAIAFYDFLSVAEAEMAILVDVDRSPLTAFNPSGSLAHMNEIDESIRRLDPLYNPVSRPHSNLGVQDFLASGIAAYMYWVQGIRIAEMLRASSILLLVVLVTFLAIRHNVNERRYEENMLVSRGAAKGDLEKIVTREILELSIISCILGIPLGLLFSRIAISATSFFAFDMYLFFTEPILVSLDSLVIAVIVGVALPMLTLGGYRAVYSTKKSVDEERGKLAKIAKGLNLIRWDVFVVAIGGLLLLALSTGGSSVTGNPLLTLILQLIPLPLFLGIASLSMKVFRRGANRISRGMKRFVGEIPSSIGIRRIGKEASSAGAAAMVLVLAICLSWNSAIIDASLPLTAENQARLAVGSDLTFTLDQWNYDEWDEFITNVTDHQFAETVTIVSEKQLYLTADYGGSTSFLAINPQEYSEIGYDYLGQRLNDSEITPLIEQMITTPDSAIITSDIAIRYDLAVGDILRASTLEVDAFPVTFRIIGITEALPQMPETWYYPEPYIGPFFPYYYWAEEVGKWRVIVNREYFGTQFNLINETSNFLCVKTLDNVNTTAIVEDVFAAGGSVAVQNDEWESVYNRIHEYVDNTQYKMERAIDTMLTVLTIGSIVGAFSIYAVEGLRARRREIALLRSVGASKNTIIRAQGAEMLVLVLFSLFLLLLYSPLFLSTSLALAGGSTSSVYEVYPIAVFTVIPWYTILAVLGFFIVTVTMFIVIIAALSSKIKLAESLNAAWAEAGPYGGEV